MAKQAASKKDVILISGSRGGLASELSRVLCNDYNLVGIDPRKPKKDRLFFGEVHRTHYRSRTVDDLFRQNKFKAFFHLGRISAASDMTHKDRYSENVLGTKHLLDLCREYEIPLVVVLSTFHIYGAHPHNPLYMTETDPLRATQTIPQLSDALELDHLATQFSLSFSGETIVLRPTNIIGPNISNTLTKIMRLRHTPTLLGFDPLYQFIHQDDLIKALRAVLDKPKRGIYNLAGPGVLPLSTILELKNIERVPVPDFLLRAFLKLNPFGDFHIPNYMVDFFKYSAVIDPKHFEDTYKFRYEHSLVASLANL